MLQIDPKATSKPCHSLIPTCVSSSRRGLNLDLNELSALNVYRQTSCLNSSLAILIQMPIVVMDKLFPPKSHFFRFPQQPSQHSGVDAGNIMLSQRKDTERR